MEQKNNGNKAVSLYWKCQLTGWSLASLYWFFVALVTSKSFILSLGIVHFIFDLIVGIGLTHAYHIYENKRKWHDLDTRRLIWRIIPAIVVISLLYMLLICLKLVAINSYFLPSMPTVNRPVELLSFFLIFIRNNGVTVFMTGIRLMSIWVLAYHLYLFARREITASKENARLTLLAKEMQLSQLSAQLNPHFLFNSLNNIKALVIDQPKSARRGIDLLSDLLRNSLYRQDQLLIRLEEELELVNDYLELEKLRFEERLQIEQELDASLLNQKIPPLTLQTLVENAIKHGISNKKEGGLIRICIKKENAELKIEVYNPGKLQLTGENVWSINGKSDSGLKGKNGLGLTNLAERLKLQYEGRANSSIAQWDAEQVLTIITIPLA